MHKLIKSVTALLMSICFISCAQNTRTDSIALEQAKQLFPSKLCKDIPDVNNGNVLNLHIVYPAACYAENWCGIHLIIKMNENEIVKYEEKIQSDIVGKYYFNSDCFDIINYKKSDHTPVILKMCDTLIDNHLPVTNFNFCFEKLPNKNFYTDATIYLINAEKGEFVEKDNLSKGVGLRCGWKNGYSKGVVINRKQGIVCFWLEIW